MHKGAPVFPLGLHMKSPRLQGCLSMGCLGLAVLLGLTSLFHAPALGVLRGSPK
jgi:hypothetical protein